MFLLYIFIFKNINQECNESFNKIIIVNKKVENFSMKISAVKLYLFYYFTVIFLSKTSFKYLATIFSVSLLRFSICLY